jgi:hypothetical protein
MKSNSWLIYIVKLCHTYRLPSPHEMVICPIPVPRWRSLVKTKVLGWWEDHTRLEAASMSTLKHLNISEVSFRKVHPVWQIAVPSVQNVERARIKARLLTGTYMFQATRSRYDAQINSTCQLCDGEPETCEHFIAVCPALHVNRQRMFATIVPFLHDESVSYIWEHPAELTQLVLDHTHPGILYHLKDKAPIPQLEYCTATLCYTLHKLRLKIINTIGGASQ